VGLVSEWIKEERTPLWWGSLRHAILDGTEPEANYLKVEGAPDPPPSTTTTASATLFTRADIDAALKKDREKIVKSLSAYIWHQCYVPTLHEVRISKPEDVTRVIHRHIHNGDEVPGRVGE
jgi:hypothetical protein